jgi:hypothetical protein
MIWRFGRWIARQEGGAAHLSWSGGEMVLRLLKNKIISIEGLDTDQVAAQVGGIANGLPDLLQEARALAERPSVPDRQALAAAKKVFVAALREWLLDPDRQVDLVDGEPDATDGPTISITHAIVELILADPDERLCQMVLPDLDVLLRRHASFLGLYSPLHLSEEADLIVAKITGQRTAREIGLRSPHDSHEILRLLAALVATGMLEPIPVAPVSDDLELLPHENPDEVLRRPLPIGWIVAGAALLVTLLGLISIMLGRDPQSSPPAETEGTWSLAIDLGCEPADLQRVLARQSQNPKTLRVVNVNHDGQECGRLVWRSFSSREEAEEAIDEIPSSFIQDGFDPHPVRMTDPGEPGVAADD